MERLPSIPTGIKKEKVTCHLFFKISDLKSFRCLLERPLGRRVSWQGQVSTNNVIEYSIVMKNKSSE